MTLKEQSLREALDNSSCTSLPKQLEPSSNAFWISAIILVKKKNLTESYALAKHRGDGSINITHDFGAMSPIAGITSIHPYLFLEESFLPKGSKKHVRDTLYAYFANINKEKAELIADLTEEELEPYKIEYAMAMQEQAGKNAEMRNYITNISESVAEGKPLFDEDDEEEDDDEGILLAAK